MAALVDHVNRGVEETLDRCNDLGRRLVGLLEADQIGGLLIDRNPRDCTLLILQSGQTQLNRTGLRGSIRGQASDLIDEARGQAGERSA